MLSKHLLICGDFNIHVDNLHNADARTLYDLLESAGLQQVISEPTHTRGHTLDLLIVRESDDSIKDVTILPTMPSDHAAITFTVALPRPPVAKKQIRIRSLRDIDYEKFNDDIISSFERVTNIADLNLDGKVELYNATLLETLDWHSPTSLRCIQLRPYAPWYDESLKILKRNVRAKERKWRNSKSTINKELLKDASSEYQSALKGAKRAYHRDKISSCDQKELFRTIQRLTVENPAQIFPSHTSKKELSQRLSQYFENKIAKLRTRDDENAENGRSEPTESFEPSKCMPVSNKPKCTFEKFSRVSQEDVRKIIKSNKIKACSLDPVPACVFRKCLDVLLPAVTDITNQSLQTGIFPTPLKSALIIPTLKKPSSDPEILKNYRPISNLPFLGKVIERTVSQQLMIHLKYNSLLASRQSAYRQHHSVETALIRVQNDLLQSMDRGNEAVLVLLDLTSAFDTVDHSILLTRLMERFGVTEVASDWFASYLSGRQQRVMIQDVTSDPAPLLWGVPQGSVVGPLLFICYTAPVEDIILAHGFSTMMYADDTQLYVTIKPTEKNQMVSKLELCLQDIRIWMKDNQLVLNDDKMEVLHVSSRFKPSQELAPITSGSCHVKPSSSLRNLGVIFDSHLTMHRHVNNICRKASLALRRIGSVRQYLNSNTTEVLVHAFVTSQLDSCNCLLLGTPEKEISKLQRIQNSAARLVSRAKKSDHITPILKHLHWLPIQSRIHYKVIFTIFKAIHGLCPAYISELLVPYIPSRLLRSSSQHLLTINPGKMKSYGERAFACGGPKLWNALPLSLRSNTKLESFKKCLKTYLFESSFQ